MNLQLLLNLALTSAHYSLLALGLTLIFRTARFFHFAHAAVYTAGAYAAYVCHGFSHNLPLAVAAGAAAGAVLGVSMEAAVYRPLRSLGARPTSMLVASIGLLFVVQGVVSLLFGDETRTMLSHSQPSYHLNLLSSQITTIQASFIAVAAIEVSLLFLILRSTRLGITLRAVASDRDLAKSRGINCDRAFLTSFLLGSILAATAGSFWAYNTALAPQMGFSPLLMAVAAMVVGGLGRLRGALYGAFLVATCQHLASWFFAAHWQDAIVFCLLLILLLFKPFGLVGRSLKQART